MGSIHNDIARYLRQQKELVGDTTWADVSRAVEPMAAASLQQEEEPVKTEAQRQPSWADAESLEELNSLICDCLDCPLGTTRTNFVFGSGNPNADLMIIGEAPGADEDKQGLPFVGRAGQLLTKILGAIEIERDSVYICNILKCRPPNNRKPLTSETDTCEPYLWKQIELVQPRYILALGLTAANTLLKTKDTMTNLRGSLHDYHGIPTMVTYHPAALLRNPEWKKATWDDVQHLQTLIQETDTSTTP